MSQVTKVALVFGASVLFSACGSFTRTMRVQQPFYVVERPATVALVSIEVPKEVMERAPSDFSNMRGMITTALEPAFAGSPLKVVDKIELGYTMPISMKAPGQVTLSGMTFDAKAGPDATREYGAEKPVGLPVGVEQDLVLGVRVVDWTMQENANVDLIYSMWTREGVEVETRRVRVTLAKLKKVQDAITLIPARNHWMSGANSKELFFQSGDLQRETMFRQAVEANTRAFAWPFSQHEMHMTAIWDESNELVKPGIALADESRFDEAAASWKKLIETNADLAPAIFNVGRVHEVKGEDQEALAAYEKAMALAPSNALYAPTHRALKERVELRKVVQLP